MEQPMADIVSMKTTESESGIPPGDLEKRTERELEILDREIDHLSERLNMAQQSRRALAAAAEQLRSDRASEEPY